MKNFWISWQHRSEFGEFELHFPWWISGTGDGYSNLCAAVKAESEEAAKKIICEHCYDVSPTYIEFRFCEERPADWNPFCDRFQRADWMKW
jgi:hypothetical protein